MSIAVKSGLPSLGSTEGAVISADEVSVSEDGSAAASVGEDLPRGKSAYEIAKENGFNGTEAEWLASLKGEPGAAGAPGKDGENGKTPYVGDNGNWYIGADDTGKPSRGAKGEPGSPGARGEPGSPGAKGDKGDTGATPNLTIGSVTTLDAGQNATASMVGTAESPVLNLGIPRGAKGEPGQGGADGKPGTDGKSAYQYAQDGGYTGTETEFAKKLAKEIPTALPNPNALTFTGAVTGSYDGSAPLTVEIPSGGSGGTDISLGLTSAAVGQTIKVKAIDESGKPTAWEAADISCELIASETLTESAATVEFTGLNLGFGLYTIIIRNTGKLTGSGLNISLNGTTKVGFGGGFYDGNGITSANISVLGSYTLGIAFMSNSGKNKYMWDSVTLPITSISVFSPYHLTDETKYFSVGTIVEIYRGVINYNM